MTAQIQHNFKISGRHDETNVHELPKLGTGWRKPTASLLLSLSSRDGKEEIRKLAEMFENFDRKELRIITLGAQTRSLDEKKRKETRGKDKKTFS